MLDLRPYQVEALEALAEAEARGVRRSAIVLPTGAGKTVVFGTLTSRTRGRVLILAHRDELITQAVLKLLEIAPDLNIGIVKAERNDVYAKVVVASVQTLAQERRRAQLFATREPFERVIVDELHHAAARSYRTVLTDAGCFRPDGPLLLGVTATPNRADGVGLSEIIEEIVYEKDIRWGIEAGYLCDLRGKQIYLDVDLDRVRQSAGDYQDGALGDALEAANAPEVIADAYQEHAAGRRAIVFTPTVHMADLTAKALRNGSQAAEMVHGAMDIDERRDVLSRFHTGETQIVANCGVLLEGYDEPAVDCIIVARPTKSRGLFVQMVGRGTRRFPGKDDCLILDTVGNTERHKLVTVNSLFGLPLDALQDGKKSVTAALREEEEQRQGRLAIGATRARDVDLFGTAKFHWVAAGRGWVLAGREGLSYEISAVGPETETWQIVVRRKGEVIATRQRPSMLIAMGACEDAVRKSGVTVLADPLAPWRGGAASPKQLETLRRLRIPIPETLTRGEASDLITSRRR